jgi:hypothetical protein
MLTYGMYNRIFIHKRYIVAKRAVYTERMDI